MVIYYNRFMKGSYSDIYHVEYE